MSIENGVCRYCGTKLENKMLDLGLSPLSNEFLTAQDLSVGQFFYPLVVHVCPNCFLAQASLYQQPNNIFGEYKYFSSFSSTWLSHCKSYVDMIIKRLNLTKQSHVLEIACNDGYLLQYFLPYQIQVKGIDPAHNVVIQAEKKGIPVQCGFFDQEAASIMAQNGEQYDLIIGNNVLAHVPDIKNFVAGLPKVLSQQGTITMEFPHILKLLEQTQFDTIYHEHFSYLSLWNVQKIFAQYKLKIYNVEQLPTHGGSLRIYATHTHNSLQKIDESVDKLLKIEQEFGLLDLNTYSNFAQRVYQIKLDTLALLTTLKRENKRIMAFGAAAKGNTFINYCGIKPDIISGVFDSNIHKQGLFLPGSLIPILSPERLREFRPDYLIILPWNIANEITEDASCIREWGGKFITCIPKVKVF